MPLPKLPEYNNKADMDQSMKAKEWNKNDATQVQDKMVDVGNGANGTSNIQNGLLQYAANEISKGKANRPQSYAIPSVSPRTAMEADVRSDSASPGIEPPDAHTPPKQTLEPEKQFILAYEALPELWDTSDIRYSNRFERFNALRKLLTIYKKIKPYATIEDVKKKINSLRSNFRRELKKFIASENSGAAASEVYYPKVWYFPYLHFLRKLEQPENQHYDVVTTEKRDSPEHIKQEWTSSESKIQQAPPLLKMKRKLSRDKSRSEYFSQPYEHRNQCQKITNPIALEWADTLERLDPLQKLYAKKAINDILFEAELGTLHKHSVRINESNYYISSPGQASAPSPHHHFSPTQQSDPISDNQKDDSDVEYKIPITLCNLTNESQTRNDIDE